MRKIIKDRILVFSSPLERGCDGNECEQGCVSPLFVNETQKHTPPPLSSYCVYTSCKRILNNKTECHFDEPVGGMCGCGEEKSYTPCSKPYLRLCEAYKISLSPRRAAQPCSIEMTFSFI